MDKCRKIVTLISILFCSLTYAEVKIIGIEKGSPNGKPSNECQSPTSLQTYLVNTMTPNQTQHLNPTQFAELIKAHLNRCGYTLSQISPNVLALVTQHRIERINEEVENGDHFDLEGYRELIRINGRTNEDPALVEVIEKERNACQSIDLRSELPPIRDQQGTGWCYGYAAADLLSHHLGENISAVDLAVGYQASIATEKLNRAFIADIQDYFNEDGPVERLKESILGGDERILGRTIDTYRGTIAPSTQNGGLTTAAIQARAYSGYCRESDLPSSNYESIKLEEAISDLIALRDEVKDRISGKSAGELAVNTCQKMGDSLGELFPNLLVSDVEAALQSPTFNDIYYSFVQQSCRDRIPGRTIEAHTTPTKIFPDGGIGEINSFLNDGKIMGISYQINMLQKDREGRHASTVVGRKWNTSRNQCEYLVRNSWGANCNSGYRFEVSCESGNVWVNKNLLKENTYRLSYIGSSSSSPQSGNQ